MTTRVEAAQEGPDDEMTESLAARSTRNVRPKTGRPVEGVLPSRKPGSKEVGFPDGPKLTPADESQMGISEMAVILVSLVVAVLLQDVRDTAKCGKIVLA